MFKLQTMSSVVLNSGSAGLAKKFIWSFHIVIVKFAWNKSTQSLLLHLIMIVGYDFLHNTEDMFSVRIYDR